MFSALPLLSPGLQDAIPNTVSYLILGYVIIAVVGLGYVISLVLRQRNLQRDVETLSALLKDEHE